MASPTNEEIKAVAKFREQIKDLELNEKALTDMQLLRWLRAREMDHEDAEKMLRDSTRWHLETGISALLDWHPPTMFLEEYPFEITGFNNNGNPVIFVPYGDWNGKKAQDVGMVWEFTKYIFRIFELGIHELEGKINEDGFELTQLFFLIDFQNFAYGQLASLDFVNAIIDVGKQIEENYPERIDQIFVINAPKIFPIFNNLVKPIMTARTMGKIRTFSGKRYEWLYEIKKEMDYAAIPPFYGGTNEGIVINHKGERDVQSELKLYKKETGQLLTKALIPRGEKLEMDFDISIPNSIITWTIELEAFEIYFSIIYNGECEAYERKQIYCDEPEKNCLVCEVPGKYTIKFDNGYSRIRNKNIYYDINVLPPDEFETIDIDSD